MQLQPPVVRTASVPTATSLCVFLLVCALLAFALLS
jgi:hypothetical protein